MATNKVYLRYDGKWDTNELPSVVGQWTPQPFRLTDAQKKAVARLIKTNDPGFRFRIEYPDLFLPTYNTEGGFQS